MNDRKLKIEYHLLNKCNLNCKSCSHFSCLVKSEKEKTLTQIKKDFAKIYELTNKGSSELVEKVTIMGGEPLLYKKIIQAVKYIKSLFKDVNVELITNGMLLSKMGEEFFETIRENDITICISIYPIKLNYDKIFKLLNSKNIKSYWYTIEDDINNPDSNKRVFDSKFLNLNYHDENYKDNLYYQNCRWRLNCTQLVDNKLYLCPLVAYFNFFDDEFKGQHNIEINETDHIDLNKINSFEELQIERDKVPHFCGYCRGLDHSREEWGITKRDIKEWVYIEEKKIFDLPYKIEIKEVEIKNNVENMINFSVVIADRNVENKLPNLLKSLEKFKTSGGEICFLDLGSTDNSLNIANEFGCRTKSVNNFTKTVDDETVRLINEKINRDSKELIKNGDQYINFSEAKNHLADLSSNDTVLMLDCNSQVINFEFDEISKIVPNYNKFGYYSFLNKYKSYCEFYNTREFYWKNITLEELIPKNEIRSFIFSENILRIETNQDRLDNLIPLLVDTFINPNDDKLVFALAIELMNHNYLESAYQEFNRHISMSTIPLDKSRSLIYLGDYFNLTNRQNDAIGFYMRAYQEYSNRRLPLYKIGLIYYNEKIWDKCIFYLEGCLNIKNFDSKIDDPLHYGEGPYSMLYVAYWWLGDKEKSKYYIDKALEKNPYSKVYLSESRFHYEYTSNDIVGNLSFKETQFLYNESKKYNSILELYPNNGRGTHALLNGCKGIVTVLTNNSNNFKSVDNYGNLRIVNDENEIKFEKFDMIIVNCESFSHNDIRDRILHYQFNTKKLIGYNYKINKQAVDETIEISNIEDNIWIKEICQFQKQTVYKNKDEIKSTKKKLAICLSGYLRTFKDCYPSILKNLIQDYDCDIFIHTYDKIGHSSGWRSPIDLSENIDMEFLETIPNVKMLVVEKWDDIKHQFEKFKKLQPYVTNINVIATIFYKIYHCNELRKKYEQENNITYDLIIRTRGDQVFEKKINLNFPKNKILINSYPWGDEDYVERYQQKDDKGNIVWDHENQCLNDRFAVGTPTNIDVLCDLYNHLEELITNTPCVELEYILYKYLTNNNIELEKRNLNFYVKHNPPRLVKPEFS